MTKNKLNIEELFSLIKEKMSQSEEGSYTSFLIEKGVEKISRKVGEEALEVVIAALMHDAKLTKKTKDDLTGEVCDLFYHTLVLLASQGIELSAIFSEFHKRNLKRSSK